MLLTEQWFNFGAQDSSEIVRHSVRLCFEDTLNHFVERCSEGTVKHLSGLCFDALSEASDRPLLRMSSGVYEGTMARKAQ
jgi:hypothetical protein